MDYQIKTNILITIVLLIAGCGNCDYRSLDDDNRIKEETLQTTEQTRSDITKDSVIKNILVILPKKDYQYKTGKFSNDIIKLAGAGKHTDTIVFNDSNDSLFMKLSNLYTTALIDSMSLIRGDGYIRDTIQIHSITENNIEVGFINTLSTTEYGVFRTDTISKGDSEYEILSKGKYKDIAPGETFTKTYVSVNATPDNNYFESRLMIIYQYNNDNIPEDTIGIGVLGQVRLNSYRATVDTLLLNSVADSMTKNR